MVSALRAERISVPSNFRFSFQKRLDTPTSQRRHEEVRDGKESRCFDLTTELSQIRGVQQRFSHHQLSTIVFDLSSALKVCCNDLFSP
jgi:hypothetical protein